MAVPPQQATQPSNHTVSDELLPETDIVREIPQRPHQLDQDAATAVCSGQRGLQGSTDTAAVVDISHKVCVGHTAYLCVSKQGCMQLHLTCMFV